MSRSFDPALYLAQPDGVFAESVRHLRTSILHQIGLGHKSYLVTSSWKSEGKSLLCLNLGLSLAETGLTVLLVDGDLRTRKLTSWIFPGFLEAGQAVRTTRWSHVSLFGAPLEESSSPGDLLIRPDFRLGVTSHFSSFDTVLMDSPALAGCSDALLLGRWVDAALMVVCKQRYQGLPEANFAEDLRASGVPLLGSVLT